MGWRARTAGNVCTPTGAFNAPLFRTLTDQLELRDRCVVLDLGAAHAQTIALFGQFSCRMDIADVADGLDSLNGSTDSQILLDAAESLLPRRRTEPTDIVLCWDILNYLERPALQALMSRIAARARPGTLVHALIVYSDTHMPEKPGNYVPQQEYGLLNVSAQTDNRVAPRYSPDDFGRHMPAYSIERAMLLGNGMQEFLFLL